MFVTLSSMSSLEEPGPGWNPADTGSVRAEALDVISDALSWRLAGTRWAAIEQVLVAMDAALAAGDVTALATATTDLELAGPVRITRIGADPVVPPPPAIRDRLNQLVHSLGGVPAAGQPDPGQQEFSS
jgi:CATRA-associated small protein